MWGWVTGFVGITGASVISFVKESWAAHLSVSVAIVCLLVVTGKVLWVLHKAQQRHYPKGYLPISAIARFSTLDGKFFKYEAVRHIQIKTAWMKGFDHKFFWTGSNQPRIVSSLQIPEPTFSDEPDGYKKVELKFKAPKFYNDTEVIHFEMSIDDSDQKSSPFLAFDVNNPMQLLEFRVDLIHANKAYMKNSARLERRLIKVNQSHPYERCEIIPFDGMTKSYRAVVIDPSPGYSYRLIWEKPAVQGVPKAKKG